MLALVLLAPLVVARGLEPAQEGLGTHQQLGLPPCTIVMLFDMRCPTCGMTTSWAYLVRGRLIGSIRANSGGALLGVITVVAVAWLSLASLRGRWPTRPPNSVMIATLAVFVAAVTLIDWTLRLVLQ